MSARHAFITGGGSGIGLASARALAATGAKLTLVGRDGESAHGARKSSKTPTALACDVTDEASVTAAFAAARDRYGADRHPRSTMPAPAPSAPFKRTTLEFWNNVLAVNLTGAFLCTRAALADMLEAKWGRIVNVGSVCSPQRLCLCQRLCRLQARHARHDPRAGA